MAITRITKVVTTPEKTVAYVLRDKVVEIHSEEEIHKDIPHAVTVDDNTGKMYVTYFTIASYKDCSPKNPYTAFQERIEEYQGSHGTSGATRSKNGNEPLMYHLRQSFNGFEVDYYTANKIGRKLADEVFKDYVVLVTTHANTEHIHNHLVISAWDSDGKKLNDNHALRREIRNVSDRLCKEYGLSVLENTKNMNLVSYKDKNGVTRYYEPTARKNDLINQREWGEATSDRVGSYRNTASFKISDNNKKTNITEIREDIDSLLPICKDYDDLLRRLRDIGYHIKSKKSNGDWLKYVSFQAPTHDKATRDKSLDDDGFYLRLNLTDYLIMQERGRAVEEEERLRKKKEEESIPHVAYFGDYSANDLDISQINEYWKTVKGEDGKYKTVKRTALETKAVRDLKNTDKERQTYKGQDLDSQKKAYYNMLSMRILETSRCLAYTERYSIYNYNQITTLYSRYKTKYDRTLVAYQKVEKTLSELSDVIKAPDRIKEIEQNVSNRGGVISDEESKKLLEYQELLKKYDIESKEKQDWFIGQIDIIKDKQIDAKEKIAEATYQMTELENCMRTYARIDANIGIDSTRDYLAKIESMRTDTSLHSQVSVANTKQKEDVQIETTGRSRNNDMSQSR